MKKSLPKHLPALSVFSRAALLLLLFTGLRASAQQVITIPPNNDPDRLQSYPLGSRPGYTCTHALYTSADLGAAGSITSVSFYVNSTNAPAASTPVVIKLKNSGITAVAQSDYITASGAATMVYSGNLTASQLSNGSWITFTLSAPFDYAGYSLELFVETNTGIPDSEGDNAKIFNWSDYVSANVSQVWSGWTAPPPANTPGSLSTYRPNVRFSVSPSSNMSFVSAQVTQTDAVCSSGTRKQVIASVQVATQGSSNPLSLEALDLSTAGTLPGPGIIQNVRVYYTGIRPVFDTTQLFGTPAGAPGSTLSVTGSQPLATGTNYLWITYDIDPAAAPGSVLDVACNQVTVSTVNHTPSVTSPPASITVGRLYDFEAATSENFSAFALNQQPNQWQRGIPTTGPAAAYSGTKCWATNLTGNYANNSNYVLTTPPYIAQSASISVNYKQWYRFITVYNIRATLEYQVNSGTWMPLNMIFNLAYETNSNNKWEDAFYKVNVSPNDTVQFRWHFETTGTVTGAPGWYIDNFLVSGVNTFNQSVASVTASHPAGIALPGMHKLPVMMMEVNVSGTDNPLTVTDLQLSGNGSLPATGLIDQARIFYTGSSNRFDTTVAFGTALTAPGATFTISGSQALSAGANYFWLAYDINAAAQAGDVLDAELLQLTASSAPHVPAQPAPAGSLPVGRLYHFDAATADYFTAATLNGKPNEWQRGTPVTGPAAAYSGTQCWGTNLTGNYTPASEYALSTPPYIVQSAAPKVNYRQWYALSGAMNIAALFQYKVNSGTWTTLNGLPTNPFNVNSGNAWQEVFAEPLAAAGDTIAFRWYFLSNNNAAPAAGWYIDNFTVAGAATFNQQYKTSTVAPASGIPSAGSARQPVVRFQVEITGADSPVAITSFDAATTGSSPAAGLIDAARIFYTGNRPDFDTTVLFGTAVPAPSVPFTVTGSQLLGTGINYFWLAYDVNASAMPGDSFNGVISSFIIDSVNEVPSVTTSPSALYVGILYDFDTASAQGFEAVPLTGTLSEWKKGVPVNTGPATAFSGTQCWGTNLGGNFTGGADYALQTPAFIAQTGLVQAGFKQWYNVVAAPDVDAEFQYQVNSGMWTTLSALDQSNYTVSSDNNWQDILRQVSLAAGDTIRFRWRMWGEPWAGNSPGWYIDHFVVSGVSTFNQSYSTSFSEMQLDILTPATRNNAIMKIMVQTTGSDGMLSATSFDLLNTGSANGIIDSARIYYTGLNNAFDTTNLFGAVPGTNGGLFTVSGNQALSTGTNYFWLTYDIAASAAPGDSVTAGLAALSTTSGMFVPPFSSLSGSIPVGLLYDFDTAGTQYFETVSLNGRPSEWQKGTPAVAGGPASAFSGTQCWGTNLAGDYSVNSDYVLLSPPYLATSGYVSVKYQQWYELLSAYDQRAELQFEVNGTGTWNTISALRTNEGEVNSRNEWERVYAYALLNAGDTVRFRWRFHITQYGPPAKGWYIDDFTVAGATRFGQLYLPSAAEQVISIARPGSRNLPVIRIPVRTTGSENPLTLSDLEFNTNGSTNAAGLIGSARVYYTGLADRFDTLTPFGAPASAPSGTFHINGSKTLLPGVNYFWLAYEIGATAQVGQVLDAECSAITIAGTSHTPVVTAPAGQVITGHLYHFDTTGNQDFYTESYNAQPSEWQRGIPLNGPASAYSGTQCWGTNLVNDYTTNSEYALVSAPYVAVSDYVNIGYKQWYELMTASSLSARFQYQLNRTGTWTDLLELNNVDYEVNSGGQWEDVIAHVPAMTGDTVQFRWYFRVDQWASTAPGWFIDNFMVSGVELADLFKPTISYTTLQGTYSLANRALTNFAQITDESGIDTVTGHRPRIFYKKTTEANTFGTYPLHNTNLFDGWKYAEATNTSSPFSFVIDYSLLTTPLAAGDEIQYFVVAQDRYASPNVGAVPGEGFEASTVNVILSGPSEVYSYTITASPLSGYYRVGSGRDYVTLSAAAADLNQRGANGPVTFVLTDSVYTAATGETFPIVWKDAAGISAANPVLIRTATGRDAEISSNNAIFKLEGSEYITIDGADSLTGAPQLTLSALSTTPMIWIASKDALKGASHNTIRNCILNGSDQTKFAVFAGGKDYTSLTAPATAPNSYNRIAGNIIRKTQCAVAFIGQSVAVPDLGNTVTGNRIGDATNPVSSVGILLHRQQQDTVWGNQVMNVTASVKGLDIGTGSGTYVAGIYISQSKQTVVSGNNVSRFVSQTTSGSVLSGIVIDGKDHSSSANVVVNNFVSGGAATSANTYQVRGIDMQYGTNDQVYHNTVHLSGSIIQTVGAAASFYNGNASAIDVRNNIFSMDAGSPVAAHIYAHQANSTYAGSTIDYNLLYANGTGNAIASVALGLSTLADWRNVTSQEVHSRSAAVTFVSATDLHLSGSSLGDWTNLTGTPMPAFASDIDGDARHSASPYMGADENLLNPLPVQLLSFTGMVSHNDVLLTWNTATEQNNKGFHIERSQDGRSFKAIGFVKGRGSNSTYSYPDAGAFAAYTGSLYYRLRQEDLNGKQTVSEIVVVSRNKQEPLNITAYPNPGAGALNIRMNAATGGTATIIVTDITGKELSRNTVLFTEGENAFTLPETTLPGKGIYFMTVDTGANARTLKLTRF